MKIFFRIVTLLIIFSLNLPAQEIPVFIKDSLDIYITRALEKWQIPGAAVLIVKDGQIVVMKGYGVKAIGSEEPVDENTLFMIGSNTKAFTCTALAMLAEEGKCSLDDKVIKYLPGFKMKDPWINENLNLTDIVTHRMGLQTFQGDFMYWTSDLTADEVIEKFGMITPKYDFRTKYGYTNAGYAIAGKVIEKLSGLSWADYLKEKIFIPLNMNRTTALSIDFAISDNIAKPHTFIEGKMTEIPVKNIDNLAPCGSIASSVEDMSHWILAQLDSGKYNGRYVIPFSVIQTVREPKTIIRRNRHPFNSTHYSLYGLGWVLEDYEGEEIVSHTGGVNGFVTSVTLLPGENLGIVVLTNNDQNAFFQMLKWEIIDAYLKLPYRNYSDVFFERFSAQREKRLNLIKAWKDSVNMNLPVPVSLSAFSGRYLNDVYGYADLILKENYLELHLEHHSDLTGKLEYIGENRFLCTYSDPTYGIKVFTFELADGKVKSFDLYVDDFIDYQAYKFVKE